MPCSNEHYIKSLAARATRAHPRIILALERRFFRRPCLWLEDGVGGGLANSPADGAEESRARRPGRRRDNTLDARLPAVLVLYDRLLLRGGQLLRVRLQRRGLGSCGRLKPCVVLVVGNILWLPCW